MLANYGYIGLFLIVAILFTLTTVLLPITLRFIKIVPKNPSATKGLPFECGMDQAGEPWSPPKLRFAAIAMLFVLFDAEAVLLFAVASRLRGSLTALIEVGVFVLFLGFGLAYAWRKGALEWRM